VASGEPVSIEQACDQVVGGDPHQHADGFDDLHRGAVAPSAAAGQTQLGMNAAGPMEHEDDLTRLRLDIGDDLMDQRPYDALLQPRIGSRIRPYGCASRKPYPG